MADEFEEETRHESVIAEGDAEKVNSESVRRTRRSFIVGGVAAAAGYGLYKAIDTSHDVGRLQAAFRRSLQFNRKVGLGVFDERGLAPEYARSRATELRLNGVVGMDDTLDLSSWRLQLAGVASAQQHPRFARDVTAWEYRYQGEMKPEKQSEDVKSAPKSDVHLDKDDKQPDAVDGPSAGPTASPAARGPGSSADVKNAPPANSLNPTGAHNSAAGDAIAARFEAMAKGRSRKRVQGNGEAGASYSSLDIGTPGLLLTMADLQKLPRVDKVLEFHCIEGWSQVSEWSGYLMRDLLEMYPPEKIDGRDPKFVYMETPDGNYYGGYDMAVMRHPQTMLVTEMAGQPLTQQHGAPLRLYTPLKYGYKQIKRIGLIAYTDQKPDDFWTKLGYDWYAGL